MGKGSTMYIPKKGEMVEILMDEEGFEGSFWSAKVLKVDEKNKACKVEFTDLLENEETEERLVEVKALALIRPLPEDDSQTPLKMRNIGDAVDCWFDDGWWRGVVYIACNDGVLVFFPYTPVLGEMKAVTMASMTENKERVRTGYEFEGGKWVERPRRYLRGWKNCRRNNEREGGPSSQPGRDSQLTCDDFLSGRIPYPIEGRKFAIDYGVKIDRSMKLDVELMEVARPPEAAKLKLSKRKESQSTKNVSKEKSRMLNGAKGAKLVSEGAKAVCDVERMSALPKVKKAVGEVVRKMGEDKSTKDSQRALAKSKTGTGGEKPSSSSPKKRFSMHGDATLERRKLGNAKSQVQRLGDPVGVKKEEMKHKVDVRVPMKKGLKRVRSGETGKMEEPRGKVGKMKVASSLEAIRAKQRRQAIGNPPSVSGKVANGVALRKDPRSAQLIPRQKQDGTRNDGSIVNTQRKEDGNNEDKGPSQAPLNVPTGEQWLRARFKIGRYNGSVRGSKICVDGLGFAFDEKILTKDFMENLEGVIDVKFATDVIDGKRFSAGWACISFRSEELAILGLVALDEMYMKVPGCGVLRPLIAHFPIWSPYPWGEHDAPGYIDLDYNSVPHYCQSNTVEFHGGVYWRSWNSYARDTKHWVKERCVGEVEKVLVGYKDILRHIDHEVFESGNIPRGQKTSLWLQGIKPGVTDETLRAVFEQFDDCCRVHRLMNPVTGKEYGHAVVIFTEERKAISVCQDMVENMFCACGLPRPLYVTVYEGGPPQGFEGVLDLAVERLFDLKLGQCRERFFKEATLVRVSNPIKEEEKCGYEVRKVLDAVANTRAQFFQKSMRDQIELHEAQERDYKSDQNGQDILGKALEQLEM